ncbi:hypothetical protein F6R98_01710 [Candidatus Methylospira mobilis]|uniref:Transporter n=1 Tax=Candidatus Methylospira mobilis TaxID=1808979 RepID=A0A5Q0BH48_9GAMM|nr:hypothetical protein [Candidatus Methylospira mobilis]QFY41497.1 hypothetical protein F6R98_01710 [Candidatus Methylospira mobilis]WNV05274.1 hypothetical protein RP726_02405 [Candidatus Methylospira mobilis]
MDTKKIGQCWPQSAMAATLFSIGMSVAAHDTGVSSSTLASPSSGNMQTSQPSGGIFGDAVDASGSGEVHLTQPPAGLMGVYMAQEGRFMFNYMPMWMNMSGDQSGTASMNPTQVATTVPGYPNSAQTVRIVPTQMSVNAQMLGGMYGLTKDINLMLMGSYMFKNMSMTTFKGMAGSTQLGSTELTTGGWGDTAASVLVKLFEGEGHEVHVIAGVSIPTGSITETGQMLSINNTMMNMRLMYGMQLGDGTYDALPGLVYTGNFENLSWGVMYRARFPMQSYNSQGWRMGNFNEGTGWLGYAVTHNINLTFRVTGSTQLAISGADPQIFGMSTGVNPNNYGGQVVNGLIGISGRMPLSMVGLSRGGMRIALEGGAPFYTYTYGVQTSEKWLINLSAAVHF